MAVHMELASAAFSIKSSGLSLNHCFKIRLVGDCGQAASPVSALNGMEYEPSGPPSGCQSF